MNKKLVNAALVVYIATTLISNIAAIVTVVFYIGAINQM